MGGPLVASWWAQHLHRFQGNPASDATANSSACCLLPMPSSPLRRLASPDPSLYPTCGGVESPTRTPQRPPREPRGKRFFSSPPRCDSPAATFARRRFLPFLAPTCPWSVASPSPSAQTSSPGAGSPGARPRQAPGAGRGSEARACQRERVAAGESAQGDKATPRSAPGPPDQASGA